MTHNKCNRWLLVVAAVGIVTCLLAPHDALGRGFGGFHGGGGFGGFHGGGGFGGGFDRGGFSGGGFDRGGFGGGGFGGGGFDRGGFNSGGFDRGGFSGGSFDRGGFGGDSFNRGAYGGSLSRGSLNSFLGLPTDGGFHAASGFASDGFGAAAGRGADSLHSWTGPEGTTIAHGTVAGQGAAVGPRGAAAGAGIASGTAVKTANGNVYTHGMAAGRGIATNGATTVAGRGFASRTTATGAWGHYSGAFLHAQGAYCNRWMAGAGIYHGAWIGAHPWAWRPAAYSAAAWGTAAWAWTSWASLGSWVGYSAAPVYYDYGDTITLQNGDVYYGDQSVGTQQDYYQSATDLAKQGGTANAEESGDWLPLGIFGLMVQGEKTPQYVFQLAIDKQGVVRGNYFDQLAGVNVPVHGKLNKSNQRVAWEVGTNKNLVFETGIYNLTLSESQGLVHFGPDDTRQFTMIRMKQPDDGAAGDNAQASAP